jgi:molecular chaperone HtpG
VTEFDGKALVSVAKGGLDLGALEDEAEKRNGSTKRRLGDLLAASRRAWASASRMSA